jgi:hypothetical protein
MKEFIKRVLEWSKNSNWAQTVVGLVLLFCVLALANSFDTRSYKTYFVSVKGNDINAGLSVETPFATIQKALDTAHAGDTVQLADGDYAQAFHSVRSGNPKLPITIKGSDKAVVRGEKSNSHVIDINHDYITLEGFTVDGAHGLATSKNDFRDKLVYVSSRTANQGINGVAITKMLIQNAGGECVRLRYLAHDNEVSYSTIRNCGIYDFRFKGGGKNGEGVYIGTAPEQLKDGRNPNDRVDTSTQNHIHHNTIETHGNECVDIKEGATENLVEYNTCSYQQDPESGGFDSRGEHNTFRFNTITNNVGAGVRLGGDSETNGTFNDVYGNTIKNNTGYSVRSTRQPQGKICDNVTAGNGDLGKDQDITKSCK